MSAENLVTRADLAETVHESTHEGGGDRGPGHVTEDGRKIGGVVMEMKNITLRFGGVTAIKDISFDIREGEIRAIIGPNGAGKSSSARR